MRRIAVATLGLLALISAAPGSQSAFAASPTVVQLRATGASEIQDIYVRPPANVPDGQPLQVVIALHGMYGNGPDFAAPLEAQADQYGWLLVAPTINYGDWTDPAQISHEDPALSAWLADEVRHLGERTGYNVEPKVLLFGHSRGAQLSLRFTEMHPDLVTAVAAVSAGTYTLPESRDPRNGTLLQFPFGVGDLARDDGGQAFDPSRFGQVPIWIGVGADDNNPADVPHDWDAYIGDDRVDRAEAFSQALREMGVNVTLAEFPGASHGLTDDMRAAGCAALAQLED
jgi:pimeloyl-ACP methyl ester carboxylesterase